METDTPFENNNNEGEENEINQLHNAWILNITFSPDGSLLVTGDVDGYFGIWDPINYKPKNIKNYKSS
jgi:WD40 repeat protein